jgi:drug/metabolite transporter (DMT)-like permease
LSNTSKHTKIKKHSSIIIYGSGFLFAILVGFSFISAKILAANGTVLEAMTWRYNFAMAFAFILLITRVIKIRFTSFVFKKAAPAALFYIAFMIMQVWGLRYSSSVESGIAFAIIPIIATILSALFLKEHANVLQIVFMLVSVLSLITMILLGANAHSISIVGFGILILSSIFMAVSNIQMRVTRTALSAIEIPIVIIIIGFIGFNLASLVNYGVRGNIIHGQMAFFSLIQNPAYFFAAAYLGIFCIFITAILMTYMTSKMPAYIATIFGNLSTAISLIAGPILLSEFIHWYQILCACLIIICVIGVSLVRDKGDKGDSDAK